MDERKGVGRERVVSERLLTPDEVAQMLAIPKSWVYGRVHSQTLPFPYVKVGFYLRFRESDILEFVQKQTISGQSRPGSREK